MNLELFKVGDIVRCKRFIRFCYGPPHKKGSLHLVQKQNEAYFNVNQKDYEKVLPKITDEVIKHW